MTALAHPTHDQTNKFRDMEARISVSSPPRIQSDFFSAQSITTWAANGLKSEVTESTRML
jgi:hypothetical protein